MTAMLKLSKLPVWAVVLAFTAIALVQSPQVQARSLDEIMSSKKMRIGIILVDQMVMRDPNSGELSGVWIDGIRRLFDTLNLEPDFVETKWATFVGGLQADQFDVFISGFMTPQRALALEYTRPVVFLGHSASALTDNAEPFRDPCRSQFSRRDDRDRARGAAATSSPSSTCRWRPSSPSTPAI